MTANTALAEQSEPAGYLVELPAGATSALTPTQMVYQLIAKGASIESVREMMALSKELAADQARRAFDAAVAAAKAEIKPVTKNRTGNNNKRYADLAAFADGIDAILAGHGLSYRYAVPEQTDKSITIACVLSHKDGHSETTPITAAPDTSGSKNAIQSIGSAITYLQRYTLTLALGLAAAEDDDGRATSPSTSVVSPAQVKTLLALKDKSNADVTRFCDFFNIDAIPDLPASRFEEAVRMLNAKAGAHA